MSSSVPTAPKAFVRRSLKLDEDSRVARLIEILTPENAQQPF